jgi:hypothetical protein
MDFEKLKLHAEFLEKAIRLNPEKHRDVGLDQLDLTRKKR